MGTKVKKFYDYVSEDSGSAQGTGVAVANQGSTTGMGNVVASQPSSTPGTAFSGDGTVGSGDIGMPLKTYTKKGATGDVYTKMGNLPKSGRKEKLDKEIKNFLSKNKKDGKTSNDISKSKPVMDYQSFLKDKVKQTKKS